MSNGLVVERSGKNARESNPIRPGARGGQRLLDGFVEELALNLPEVHGDENDEKAKSIAVHFGH